MRFEFDAELWPFDATQRWVFLSLTADDSEYVREMPRERRAGFGSVRVRATIGDTVWLTSIFPQAGGGVYILPIKKAVRSAEGVDVGDVARVAVEVLD